MRPSIRESEAGAKRFQSLADRFARRLRELDVLLTQTGAWKAKRRGMQLGSFVVLRRLHDSGFDFRSVIDVGASVGTFSAAARHVFPHARVYAFEPLGIAFDEFQRRNGSDPMIHCRRVALGSHKLRLPIHVDRYLYSSSLLRMTGVHQEAFPYTGPVAEEAVEVIPLDDAIPPSCLERPALLKIDVQGYELEVLAGAGTILDAVDALICEMSFVELYAGQPRFDAVYRFIVEHGFEFGGAVHQLRHPRTGEVLQMDGLFRRRDPRRGA